MAADDETVRRGLLKFLVRKGGAVPIKELHTHSLLMFQVAHQAFSQVMEGLVADTFVTYDQATHTFHLTDAGRAWFEAQPS